jgi:plasmid stabilization system protein ParE
MIYKARILPAAKDDIHQAAQWYNNQKTGLGKQFTHRVRERVKELKKNPFVCQVRYKEVHTAIVRQFQFMIHYTIDQDSKTIEIIAVLSTHRDPKIWIKRSNDIEP